MATRKPSRSEWQLKSGKWTRSLGSRGTRVRLFQKRSGGLFYRAFWVPSRGVDRKCLGTHDRAEAERLGKALLGALLKGDEIESSRALPLGTLGYYYRTRSVVLPRVERACQKGARCSDEDSCCFFRQGMRRPYPHARGSNRFRKKATSWPDFLRHVRQGKGTSHRACETAVSSGRH